MKIYFVILYYNNLKNTSRFIIQTKIISFVNFWHCKKERRKRLLRCRNTNARNAIVICDGLWQFILSLTPLGDAVPANGTYLNRSARAHLLLSDFALIACGMEWKTTPAKAVHNPPPSQLPSSLRSLFGPFLLLRPLQAFHHARSPRCFQNYCSQTKSLIYLLLYIPPVCQTTRNIF